MRQYFYAIDGVEHGPIPYSELVRLRLPRDSKVWYDGLGDWVRADKLPALKEVPLSAARDSVGISTDQKPSFTLLDVDFEFDGKPQNYRVYAIVAVVLSVITCSVFTAPVAITAFVFSFLVDNKYRDGFFLASENMSKYTKILLLVAAGFFALSLVTSAMGFLF